MASKLLRVTIPKPLVHAPGLILTREQADAAMAAVKSSTEFANVQGVNQIFDGIDMLTDPNQNTKASRVLEEATNRLRGELYVGGHDDPERRFEIHQLLMTSGFYARAANLHSTPADPTRFLSNHYNFDVRRDKTILGSVKDAVFADQPKPESNKLLGLLLQTERHLFGQERLRLVGGKQFLLPGVSLRLVKTEAELKRLLELPPVVEHGNYQLVYTEAADNRVVQLHGPYDKSFYKAQECATQERWRYALVQCKPEPENLPSAIAQPPVASHEDLRQFRLRCLLAPPYRSFAERLKEQLLQLWVYWFAFWVLFWMVDEEVLTLLGLLIARWQQMNVLREEAKRTSGKVYIATSRFS